MVQFLFDETFFTQKLFDEKKTRKSFQARTFRRKTFFVEQILGEAATAADETAAAAGQAAAAAGVLSLVRVSKLQKTLIALGT